MIVVDTNLIGYLLMQSPHTAQAERILEADPVWLAPALWQSELRNVLSQYVRLAYMQLHEAMDVTGKAEAMMYERSYEVDSVTVLRLAASSGCTAYDCEFVATAQETGLQLVTFDKQVLAAFPQLAVSPQDFLQGV